MVKIKKDGIIQFELELNSKLEATAREKIRKEFERALFEAKEKS